MKRDEIATMQDECMAAAEHYSEYPGQANAAAIIDLYAAMARLCAAVLDGEGEKDAGGDEVTP